VLMPPPDESGLFEEDPAWGIGLILRQPEPPGGPKGFEMRGHLAEMVILRGRR
jgi:hypothetical protein